MRFRVGVTAALAVVVSACVTVNIYFPAPEIREAAEEIVDETWGGSAAMIPGPAPLSAAGARLSWLSPRAAWAGADIDVSTASIRNLKEAMKQRAVSLKPYLGAGYLGLANDGMLAVLHLDGLALADKAAVRRLVDGENGDRNALYAEIARANDLASEHVGEIASIFADTWREHAEAGWWVQDDDGEWTRR